MENRCSDQSSVCLAGGGGLCICALHVWVSLEISRFSWRHGVTYGIVGSLWLPIVPVGWGPRVILSDLYKHGCIKESDHRPLTLISGSQSGLRRSDSTLKYSLNSSTNFPESYNIDQSLGMKLRG